MDIAAWLSGLGLAKYATIFAKNEITPEVLPHLSDADLEALGLPMGPRKLVLAAIAGLGNADMRDPKPVAGSTPRVEAERRQLTVMFVDLVGSTALSSQLDPEEMAEVIGKYQNAVAGEITRVDGHVAKFMGDGVLAYFGWPRAHEDEAERAVRAGLAITAAVAKLVTPANEPLGARVGIATGLVVVGDLVGEGAAQEAAVVGETPNLAARLQSLAEVGCVVVAGPTRRLLGEIFELVDLGTHDLKGFAHPVQAWRVVGASLAEGRFEALHGMRLTALVGRDQELAALLECWRRAKAGRGQVALLSGEPGIGKSRIAIALRERLRGEECVSLRYHGSPYHTNSALFPVLEQLRRAAGFEHEDTPEVKLTKLEALLALAVPDPKSAMPLIAEHLAIPTSGQYPLPEVAPEQKKAKTFQTLIAQLEGLAAKQPVLMTAEDVHWFDPTSLELFDRVVDRIERLPVLLVVTFRPEFAPRWTSRPHVTLLTLNRLGQNESTVLIDHLSGGRPLPVDVQAQILAKTEGVPLFVEELTKAVLESRLLRETGKRYEVTGSLPPLAIPSTLQDSLLARLDRLMPVKEIAQIGAVIGREFSYELLAATAQMDEPKLRTALDELVRAELAFCRDTPPDAIYTFKHALVRDAAYESLLKSRRQQLHCRIATVLRERFPDRAEAEPEVLAHHATEGGLLDDAVSYWHKAGLRANYRSANAEAIAHLSKGLDLLATLPETAARDNREIDLQLALGIPQVAAKGHGSAEVMAAYTRAQELCNRHGSETSQFFPVLRGLWTCNRARGQMHPARDLADQLVTIARRSGDQSLLLEAHHTQWTTHYCLGEWRSVCEHTARGLALYRREHFSHAFMYGGHDPAVCATAHEGVSLWMLGFPDRALARAEEAVTLARKLAHPPSIMHALWYAIVLHCFRRDADAAREKIEAVLQMAHDWNPRWIPYATLQMAYISAHQNKQQARVCICAIQEALAAHLSNDVEVTGFHVCLFATACGLASEADIGLNALKPAIEEVAATGAHLWESELHRIAGNLLLSSATLDVERSEAHYLRAIEVAREQHAASLNLRASTSLARLWVHHGERHKAYDLLAPVYAWFTEGFETRDLVDAKALLDQLR
ncbi:AAA family ATPase [Phyllobacterium sp. A18/5-2]|uniref:adenylate/guanylate cyclase domain-containing protein n=1 Tax=Phyllobacterium sp. A18/5-2 TaxID=2978392 RepID=UPI0021C60D77|nr:adenylate/guanylate cyclase domain-containing protein [Phyllobacterium sp. A18/5-2]UXN64460.1 AAA family ATPase [Phyllobacterium sp. A18/5-2]